MRRAFLLLIILISATSGFSCSCELISFCETTSERPGDNIFKIVILTEGDHSIQVLKLETIRGAEVNDTLIIWDGTDYDCNGNISMAASQIGDPGDTLLIILPLIDSIENAWDIIGDYRMPNWMCNTYKLKIENNMISGDINGLYPYYYLGNYNYDTFIENWFLGDETCSLIPTTFINDNVTEGIQIFPNPSNGQFIINVESLTGEIECSVTDASGREIINQHLLNKRFLIELNNFPDGIYLLTISQNDQKFIIGLLVKTGTN